MEAQEERKRIQVVVDGWLWKQLAHEAVDAGISVAQLVRMKLAKPVGKPKPGGVVERKHKVEEQTLHEFEESPGHDMCKHCGEPRLNPVHSVMRQNPRTSAYTA